MHCKDCGAQIPEASKFCNCCGSNQGSTISRGNHNTLISILLIAVLVACGVTIYLNIKNARPVSVVQASDLSKRDESPQTKPVEPKTLETAKQPQPQPEKPKPEPTPRATPAPVP